MVLSMTAYARHEQQTEVGGLSCEIRGVNHRYLDIILRMPEEIRPLEPLLRERVGASIKRGKIEVNLRWIGSANTQRHLNLNSPILAQLQQSNEALRQQNLQLSPPTWLELLRWPGVLLDDKIDEQELSTAVLSVVQPCLEDLIASRRREGQSLGHIIAQRIQSMANIVEQIAQQLPDIVLQQREKLHNRLQEIKGELDQNRLEQEMLYIAQRMDVDEEIQRLRVHMHEVTQTLQRQEPIGRRLDFLMQELNREANTLGSKSVHTNCTKACVDLKVLIEQIREQVQNIE